MSSNPYENEPGFETANGGDDKNNQKAYVAKVIPSTANFDASSHNLLRSGMKLYG